MRGHARSRYPRKLLLRGIEQEYHIVHRSRCPIRVLSGMCAANGDSLSESPHHMYGVENISAATSLYSPSILVHLLYDLSALFQNSNQSKIPIQSTLEPGSPDNGPTSKVPSLPVRAQLPDPTTATHRPPRRPCFVTAAAACQRADPWGWRSAAQRVASAPHRPPGTHEHGPAWGWQLE